MSSRGFETDILENWPNGVLTSILSDRLPDGAVPEAINAQFHNVGPQITIFGTRKGCAVQNAEAADDAIISQHFLNTNVVDVHLVVDGDGNLKKLETDTLNEVEDGLFSETDNQFSWQTFSELAFVVNGEEAYKTDGNEVWAFGIEKPADPGSDWDASAVAGGADLPPDTYDIAISYFNADTNHEGPISEIKEVEVEAGQRIQVDLPNLGEIDDPQVTHIKIYIRPHETSNLLLLVVSGTDVAIDGTNGWPVGTTQVYLDIFEEDLLAFRVLAPEVNDNYPPPDGTNFICAHRGRMFAATDTNIYWSKPELPEAFNHTDATIAIGLDDGETITGLAAFNDVLVVFTRAATYALVGDDPQTWEPRLIDVNFGCVSSYSIGQFDNRLFWMSLKGPVTWSNVGTQIQDITSEFIGPEFDEDHIDIDTLSDSVLVGHPVDNYVGWAITPKFQTKNTVIIPFNFKLNRWMSRQWRMVDVKSCTLVNDASGRSFPMIGDYDGWIYKVGVATRDGVPGTERSEGTVDTGSATEIVDLDADWTPDILIGRYVYVYNPTDGARSAQRRKIIDNTDDTLTVEVDFSPPPDTGWVYNIGGILLDWRSAFRNGGGPFFKKRIEFGFLELAVSTQGVDVDVEFYKDSNTTTPVHSRTVTIGEGALWDVDDWDVAFWASEGLDIFRIPIRTVGYSWQTRVVHMSSGEQLYIRRNSVQWLTKTKHTSRG